jgi:transposase
MDGFPGPAGRVGHPDLTHFIGQNPGARHFTRFEDTVAWLAQQMAFAPITRLLRIGWRSVGPIVARVVADHLNADRLQGLVCIGVDEISYRRHHRYLTSVADHQTGAIVWCAPGRNSATLQGFFDELGDRKRSIRAISIDMSGEYQRAIRAAVPEAEICFDPFQRLSDLLCVRPRRLVDGRGRR